MASALAVAQLLMSPPDDESPKASGQNAFAAAFPNMAPHWSSKHTSFYNYLNAWSAAPCFLKDRYAGEPGHTWRAFMRECAAGPKTK